MPSARSSMLDRAPHRDAQPTTRRSRGRWRFAAPASRRARAAPPAGSRSLLVIALWQLAGSAGWVNPLFLPRAVGDRGRDLQARACRARSGSISSWSLHADRRRAGSSAPLPASSSVSRSGCRRLARGVGITFISALFPIPKIALLPLLILWLGIGEEPKIATIALGVFFPTAISVYSGVDAVPRNLIRMAQSFNVPFHAIVRRVIWPGALPAILAGFRITASVALLLVVSAEMIGAQYGIGAFVLQAGNLMQTDQLLAGVVILSLFGLAVGKLINLLETRLLHWR